MTRGLSDDDRSGGFDELVERLDEVLLAEVLEALVVLLAVIGESVDGFLCSFCL